MRNQSRVATAIWIFLCATTPASTGLRARRVLNATPAAPNAQRAVIQLERRWLANEYNPSALESILADDFVHVLPEGFITKREQIRFVHAHAQPRLAEHKFEKLEVRVYGSVAIANGIVVAVPEGKGAPRKTIFTDVFALRNSRWQAVNAQETLAADERK